MEGFLSNESQALGSRQELAENSENRPKEGETDYVAGKLALLST